MNPTSRTSKHAISKHIKTVWLRNKDFMQYVLNHYASNTPKSSGQHGPTLYPCFAAVNSRCCWLDKSKKGQTMSHYSMTYSMLIAALKSKQGEQRTTTDYSWHCYGLLPKSQLQSLPFETWQLLWLLFLQPV